MAEIALASDLLATVRSTGALPVGYGSQLLRHGYVECDAGRWVLTSSGENLLRATRSGATEERSDG